MTQKYRVFPTLDMYFDIQANTEDEAIAKVDELAKAIIDECASKLSALGFLEGGCDSTYITDDWEEFE